MGYKLAAQSGDTLAVPQVVLAHVAQADGDAVRVALYALQTGVCEPRALAKALGLPSVEAAKRALQYWAGAGLLEQERRPAPSQGEPDGRERTPKVELSDMMNDPYVAVLCEEAQTAFGKALGRSELLRLVDLYAADGWKPDVILLCCAEVARQGKHTVGAVARELARWREQGVESGEDAERLLRTLAQQAAWCEETAAQFGQTADTLTRWEKTTVVKWRGEWGCTPALIDEALLRADKHCTVRYVDGILRAWRAQGITTAEAARGQGQLSGSNITATERPAAAAASTQKDLFHQDWNTAFDEEG